MARKKRTTRKAEARAAAVPAADVAPPSTDPMRTLIAATSQRVCVSLSSTTASSSAQPDPEPASPAHDDNTDSDAPQQRRKRTKVGHYNPRLTEEQRLDILRLHISEGKTARAIHKLYEARGHIVPEGTIYTLFRKQAHNRPLVPQKKRTAHKRYTEEDRRVVVQAQTDHNDWTYDQLRSAWAAANPESRYRPSNDTIHGWLKDADFTSKRLVPVPKARNEPANIADRHRYSLEAMTWDRDTLIFIDETTFSRGLHSSRGRSPKGKLAVYTSLNSPGPGVKVCAAVSQTQGLVMWDTQLQAYDGPAFALFITRLCAQPALLNKSCILVLDNVRVHHTQVVKDALAGAQAEHTLKFLPVYSPHLNPIEYCFHNWKNEIKHIDQLKDKRSLHQQVEDTRLCVTDKLVKAIINHVYQLYSWCIQDKPLEEFEPIGKRVARAKEEQQRNERKEEEDEKKE